MDEWVTWEDPKEKEITKTSVKNEENIEIIVRPKCDSEVSDPVCDIVIDIDKDTSKDTGKNTSKDTGKDIGNDISKDKKSEHSVVESKAWWYCLCPCWK